VEKKKVERKKGKKRERKRKEGRGIIAEPYFV